MSDLSQRLRSMAAHTGLDAVAELLVEAADHIDSTPQPDAALREALRCAIDEVGLNEPWQRRHLADRLAIHARRLGATQQPAPQLQITDAMIDAANRTCRSQIHEQCEHNWEPRRCKSCRDEAAADLMAAFAVAPRHPLPQPVAQEKHGCHGGDGATQP